MKVGVVEDGAWAPPSGKGTNHMRLGRPLLGVLAAGPLLLAPGPAAASSSARPLTVTFAGHVEMPVFGAPVFAGGGQATHMGRVATDGYAFITGPDETTCPGGLANVHVETLTAAAGDTLTITSLDVACPVGPAQFDGTGHWTVTGGTGRFENANGAGTFDGTLDFAAGTFSITLKGAVTFGR